MTGSQKIVRGRCIDGTVYVCGWRPSEPEQYIMTFGRGEAQRMTQEWAEGVIDAITTGNMTRGMDSQIGHLTILDAPDYVNSGMLVAWRSDLPEDSLPMEWDAARVSDLENAVDTVAMLRIEHELLPTHDVTLYTDDGRAMQLRDGEFRAW